MVQHHGCLEQDNKEEISRLNKEVAPNKHSANVTSKPAFGLKCTKCKFIADSETILKKHMEVEYEEVVKCKHCMFTTSSSTVEFHSQMAH